ncbi:hypothetical protein PHPALM_27692, partial [Phytophthora palmivora]
MNASGASPTLVLENVVKYADPELKLAMMAKYDPARSDPLQQASELVNWAQSLADEEKPNKAMGRDTAKETVSAITDDRGCFKCGKTGHFRRDCPLRQKEEWRLSPQDWILDSGASRHMVNDKSQLQDISRCHNMEESVQPDGSGLEVTLKGTAVLHTVVDGVLAEISLGNVFYAPKLTRNLVSYGQLLKQGCSLCEVNGNLAVTKGDPARVVFYVDMKANVLVARVEGASAPKKHLKEVVMSAVLDESSGLQKESVQHDTLMGFHVRFGHLAYDTIERIAKDPASGIVITSHERSRCTTCAEGKQTRADQPKKDTGAHAPVDRV